MSSKETKMSGRDVIRLNYRAYLLLKKYCPGLFASIGAVSVCKAITPYINIWLSAQIINELAGERDVNRLWQLVFITILANALCSMLIAILNGRQNVKKELSWFQKSNIYVDKMLELDFAALDDQHTYDLRSQIGQNERWSGWGFNKVLWYFEMLVNSICRIISAVALTVSLFTMQVSAEGWRFLNHPLCAGVLIIMMLTVAFVAPMLRVRAGAFWASLAEDAKLGNRYFTFFSHMAQEKHRREDIRIYNQQDICDYYAGKETMFTPKSKMAAYARGPMGLLNAGAEAITNLFMGLVYVFVCLKAWAGAFGVGSVTQYIGAITSLSQGVTDFMIVLGDMRNNAVFLKTTFEFLDIPNEMYQGSLTTEKRADRNYEVEFRDVSFKYPGSENYSLRHVSMKFKVGQRLAVVGMNGSGKTTFIKLLCRLYDPTEGEILLNGIDIRKYNYRDYMNLFSVVFQDFQLLALPLGQNVAASGVYDKEQVVEVLRNAGFEERLQSMPEGVETYLYKEFDASGVEISGGEAQKIAIARALYKDAPFIILDEPTAALDPIAEMEIYQKFNDIVGDKTAIYISHRLSSCRFCDEILVFHEGNVVQKGSHEELVGAQGKYHELWHAQAQYYQEKDVTIG